MVSHDSPAREPDLVIRARDGDQQAVAELFTAYWGAARGFAYAVLRDITRAEDAAADAFLQALPGLKRLRDPARFGPWLRRIVRRVARKQLERTARTASLDDRQAAQDPDPGVEIQRAQMALLVARGVEHLPDAEREAIVLCYLEGYSTEQAARFLDIPVGSLRRRLHDGRRRLQRILTDLLASAGRRAASLSELQARLQHLLSPAATEDERYGLGRELLLMRPVPAHLLATAVQGASLSAAQQLFAAEVLTRQRGPLLEDPGPAGAVARDIRATLSDFTDWSFDVRSAIEAFAQARPDTDHDPTRTPTVTPSPFTAGLSAGRYVRATRGLLAGRDDTTAIDLWAAIERSESLSSLRDGLQQLWMSDVFDVWWAASHPLELSDVEAWVTALAQAVAPTIQTQWALYTGPRYRRALRLTFAGDGRPAAIGGVLASTAVGPDAVHVRLYLEPWAQARTGQRVSLEPLRRPPTSG